MQGIRFAPSPTGRFHVGNLRTAWISWKIARHLGEPWIVRFEDIDRLRVISGAREQQLHDLEQLGMTPDQTLIQSQNHQRHYELFQKACARNQVYRCTCSRQEILHEIEGIASAPHAAPPLYTGKCRHQQSEPQHPTVAWRFRNPQDPTGQNDFIVARTPAHRESITDFSPAYHWACAIDDHDGNYKLLVRAWDLEPAQKNQNLIHRWVAEIEGSQLQPPPVFHTSLVVQNDGHRLEKRTRGVTLDEILVRMNIADLLNLFEKSFDVCAWRLSGETLKTLTLAQLHLTHD